jgi:hypothetical protein
VPDTNRVGITNLSLRGKFESEGHFLVKKLAEAKSEYGDNLKATIEFRGPVLQSVPLGELQRRLNQIKELRRHLEGRSNLFVVTEALRVDSFEYKFDVDQTGGAGLGLPATKDLQAAVKGDFDVTASGSLVTKFPVFLGYKAQALETVANSLGGDSRVRIADLMTPEQVERAISPSQLHSDVQVFVLAIGLGNYTRYSQRVGGKLLNAKDSVGLVANRLKQLHGPKGPAYVEIHMSAGDESAQRAITRQEFIDAVDRFVAIVKDRVVPGSTNLVVFYYFGHGISEPVSRMALLVPEDFADVPDKKINGVWGNLIKMEEIVGKLERLPCPVLFLVDSCRTREQKGEIQPTIALGPALPPGFGQLLGKLDLVPWPNYFDGPNPVIFSSKDREQALLVPHVMSDGRVTMIGPLAERFDRLWRRTISQEEVLSLKKMVEKMTTGDEEGGPVGYRAWRGDLRLPEDALVNPRK